ncbi:hypothetical protein PROFUN_03801 [Planoprotostelium fungivorum]|uniref:N-acetyltransferase domain-containing protein n=1 Tax=Planoprotostelium fungivorum TaxID=1890364 RepID=A0A2P6NI56_9EUKA|nr:hypothetical protein PROFUN_03801 [Planoprotostelium fungivorum]
MNRDHKALRTERLVLCPAPLPGSSFWPFWNAHRSDPIVSTMAWGGTTPPISDEELKERAIKQNRLFNERGHGIFGVAWSSSQKNEGVEIRNHDDWLDHFRARTTERRDYDPVPGAIELLYSFIPAVWGKGSSRNISSFDLMSKGVAGEAVKCVIDHGLRVAKLEKITAAVLPNNSASLNVLTKAGLTNRGNLYGYAPEDVFYEISH